MDLFTTDSNSTKSFEEIFRNPKYTFEELNLLHEDDDGDKYTLLDVVRKNTRSHYRDYGALLSKELANVEKVHHARIKFNMKKGKIREENLRGPLINRSRELKGRLSRINEGPENNNAAGGGTRRKRQASYKHRRSYITPLNGDRK